MPGNQTVPLVPTWHGFISSTEDALMLFEGVLRGDLTHVPRRPHDRERVDLIQSGSIFVYSESSSGIKRWTDGVTWSPSRILGNFLIYRELDQAFAPGEKKRALKKRRQSSHTTNSYNGESSNISPEDRALVGSLVDSYSFKERGLVKKTISVTFRGLAHHLVSYYRVADVKEDRLERPIHADAFTRYSIRKGICIPSQARNPSAEDSGYSALNTTNTHPSLGVASMSNPYGMSLPPADAYEQHAIPHQHAQHGEYTTGGVSRHFSQGDIRQSFHAPGHFPLQNHGASNNQGFNSPMSYLTHQTESPFGIATPTASAVSHVAAVNSMPQLNFGSTNQSQPLAAMEPRHLPRQESAVQHHPVHSGWDSNFAHYGSTQQPEQLFAFPSETSNTWS